MSAIGSGVGPFSERFNYSNQSEFVVQQDDLLALRELDTEAAKTLYTQLSAVREHLKTAEDITVKADIVKDKGVAFPLSASLIVSRSETNLSSFNVQNYLDADNVASGNLSVIEDEYDRKVVHIRGDFGLVGIV